MFWKFIRWGGTAIILLLLAAALFTDQVVTPAPEAQPSKNFNL